MLKPFMHSSLVDFILTCIGIIVEKLLIKVDVFIMN